MHSDTRKLLAVGVVILLAGAISALLMFTVFGGISREGPHTNGGWIALIITIGCLPAAIFTLLLGLSKLFGDLHRS